MGDPYRAKFMKIVRGKYPALFSAESVDEDSIYNSMKDTLWGQGVLLSLQNHDRKRHVRRLVRWLCRVFKMCSRG